MSANPNSQQQWDLDEQIGAKFMILFNGYRKMFDQSLLKSRDLNDMLRFLPGVVVQKEMKIQGMAALYRIEPSLLERFIKFTTQAPGSSLYHILYSHNILDDYLSGFLQDRDRSQLYYCDPILQYISICRNILSLLDGSNAFDLQS
jgi:hypothetical protein